MNNGEAALEIFRSNGKLTGVNVFLPMWQKEANNGQIYINLPLLGLPEIYADNENDVDSAIDEAIQCFIVFCESYGNGLESELELLGWTLKEKGRENSLLQLEPKSEALELMMNTGSPFAHSFQMHC